MQLCYEDVIAKQLWNYVTISNDTKLLERFK